MDKKLRDSQLLAKLIEASKKGVYTFGAYTDYNELDVKNLKNPLLEILKKQKQEA